MRLHLITGHEAISLTNGRQPTDYESRYQGSEYSLTSVNKGVKLEHLKNPSFRRH
jgi:hypothetical protein